MFPVASLAEGHEPGDSLRGEAAGAEGVKRLLSHSSEFNREYITVRSEAQRSERHDLACAFSLPFSRAFSRGIASRFMATIKKRDAAISEIGHALLWREHQFSTM